MEIRENDLRYSISANGNSDRASVSVSIQTQGHMTQEPETLLPAPGIEVDKQATATVKETIVIRGGGGDHEYYSGPYAATPMITSQTFPTEEKLMAHDFFVHTIPTTETLNAAGGYTFKIG